MLKNEISQIDILEEKRRVRDLLPDEVRDYFFAEKEDFHELIYPVLQYPTKVTSLNLDKTPNYSGILTGVKGQYLIFEDGTVFNVRTFEGYVVRIEV